MDTKDLDLRNNPCPQMYDRDGQQLYDNLRTIVSSSREDKYLETYTSDRYRGESEEEELVQAGNNDGPNNADEPRPECRGGHVCIVSVGHCRTDFRIRRVILYDGRQHAAVSSMAIRTG